MENETSKAQKTETVKSSETKAEAVQETVKEAAEATEHTETKTAAVHTETVQAKAEIQEDKESSKKATIALVLGIIAIVFLAGTKLIVGNLFFYLGALILGAIALYFAMKTTQLTKKAILAVVIAASPVVVSGYNLAGIAVRDAIIDAEFHHMEHEVERGVRNAEEFLPDMEKDLHEDFALMDEDMRKDAQEFEQKVKEDAASSANAADQKADASNNK